MFSTSARYGLRRPARKFAPVRGRAVSRNALPGWPAVPLRARSGLRFFFATLLCLLFSGHLVLAATNPCNGLAAGKCGSVVEERADMDGPGADESDTAGLQKQGHASQCQDHCKSVTPLSVFAEWPADHPVIDISNADPPEFAIGGPTPPPQ